jgi:hypothetical protein
MPTLFLVLLVIVVFLLIRTLGNEMLSAAIIEAQPLLPVRKLSPHYLIPLLLQAFVVLPHKESNIINLYIFM